MRSGLARISWVFLTSGLFLAVCSQCSASCGRDSHALGNWSRIPVVALGGAAVESVPPPVSSHNHRKPMPPCEGPECSGSGEQSLAGGQEREIRRDETLTRVAETSRDHRPTMRGFAEALASEYDPPVLDGLFRPPAARA